jgi:hypothetical protein
MKGTGIPLLTFEAELLLVLIIGYSIFKIKGK